MTSVLFLSRSHIAVMLSESLILSLSSLKWCLIALKINLSASLSRYNRQAMTVGVFQGAKWARTGGSSPRPPDVWHLTDIGHVHVP